MKKFRLAVAIALSAAAVYFLAAPKKSGSPAGGAIHAPALAAPALDGKTVALSDFSGKVVLVDFWATWCDPCREEIPDLAKLHDRLKGKGFSVLGVSMDEEGEKAVRKFMAKQPISYPVILNGGERPPTGWSVPGLPTAYLIAKDGTVLKRWFGSKDIEELSRDVEAALAR